MEGSTVIILTFGDFGFFSASVSSSSFVGTRSLLSVVRSVELVEDRWDLLTALSSVQASG